MRAVHVHSVQAKSRGWRDGGGVGAHPAGPVDEVVQLGHHILAPAARKRAGFGDHGSSLGQDRLCAGNGTRHREVLVRQESQERNTGYPHSLYPVT